MVIHRVIVTVRAVVITVVTIYCRIIISGSDTITGRNTISGSRIVLLNILGIISRSNSPRLSMTIVCRSIILPVTVFIDHS